MKKVIAHQHYSLTCVGGTHGNQHCGLLCFAPAILLPASAVNISQMSTQVKTDETRAFLKMQEYCALLVRKPSRQHNTQA